MYDSIDPLPWLVIMAILVVVWLIIGIRDHLRIRRTIDRFHRAVERMSAWADIGACAHIWVDADSDEYSVCTRNYEHTGPHLDSISKALRR